MSGNGRLVLFVKGTKSVASQLAKKYFMSACIPEIIQLFKVSESAIEYCSQIMSYALSNEVCQRNDITLLDLPVNIPLTEEEAGAIRNSGHLPTSFTYERMIKGGVKYHASCYRKQGIKCNDSFVKTFRK